MDIVGFEGTSEASRVYSVFWMWLLAKVVQAAGVTPEENTKIGSCLGYIKLQKSAELQGACNTPPVESQHAVPFTAKKGRGLVYAFWYDS